MSYLSSDDFISICYECEFDVPRIQQKLQQLPSEASRPNASRPYAIRQRIDNLRKRGLLPFESGNSVPQGTILKGITTTYDTYGNITRQTIRADVPKDTTFSAIESAIIELASTLPVQPNVSSPTSTLVDDLATLYISNDLHMGALMWDKESGADWNVDIASQTIKAAYDYLFDCSPNSKVGIIVDLGEILPSINPGIKREP